MISLRDIMSNPLPALGGRMAFLWAVPRLGIAEGPIIGMTADLGQWVIGLDGKHLPIPRTSPLILDISLPGASA